MASIKCNTCERYSKIGCPFEITQYYKYKDCVLGRRSYWVRKQETADTSEEKPAEMPAKGSNR